MATLGPESSFLPPLSSSLCPRIKDQDIQGTGYLKTAHQLISGSLLTELTFSPKANWSFKVLRRRPQSREVLALVLPLATPCLQVASEPQFAQL